jgi:Glycosyl hydrolases family 39
MRDRHATQFRSPWAVGVRRGARGGRRTVGALVTLALLTFLLGSGRIPISPGGASEPTAPEGPLGWNAAVRHRPNPDVFAVGVTHSQHSIDAWGDVQAQARARAVLSATATYQNQHIFGWGALNPEPSPGEYDWSSLDRRMELIRATGSTPVITLCCAPDWMKGGRAGETDWRRLAEAPTPQHYADFAALAAAVARRYPDVRYFLVWNELKGFWNQAQNRWDYEAYTRLYNRVYDALKAVDPTLRVGGPYVTFDVWHDQHAGGHPSDLSGACGVVDQRSLDVLEYWLEHKQGADFVAIDASSSTRDDGQVVPAATAVQTFDALTRWVRQRTSLPVWWSEFHVGQGEPGEQQQLTAKSVAALLRMATGGAAVALIWQPQLARDPDAPGPPALWTSTEHPGGGQPLGYAEAIARMQSVLADLSGFEPVSWPRPDVGVLHGRQALLLVNVGEREVPVTVEGLRLRLGAFEVRRVPMPEGAPSGLRAARDGRYGTFVRIGATALSVVVSALRPETSGANSCLRPRPSARLMPTAGSRWGG